MKTKKEKWEDLSALDLKIRKEERSLRGIEDPEIKFRINSNLQFLRQDYEKKEMIYFMNLEVEMFGI